MPTVTPPPVPPGTTSSHDPQFANDAGTSWDQGLGLGGGLPLFVRGVPLVATGVDLSAMASTGSARALLVTSRVLSPLAVTALCALVVTSGYYAAIVSATAGPTSISLNSQVVIRDVTKLPSPSTAQVAGSTPLTSFSFVVVATFPYQNYSVGGATPLSYFLQQPGHAKTDGYGNTVDAGDSIALDLAVVSASATAWAGTIDLYYPLGWFLLA